MMPDNLIIAIVIVTVSANIASISILLYAIFERIFEKIYDFFKDKFTTYTYEEVKEPTWSELYNKINTLTDEYMKVNIYSDSDGIKPLKTREEVFNEVSKAVLSGKIK